MVAIDILALRARDFGIAVWARRHQALADLVPIKLSGAGHGFLSSLALTKSFSSDESFARVFDR